MEFKNISYRYEDISQTISKKGRRKTDDPTKILRDQLQDGNIVYFFYKDNDCLYVGESKICLWDRIIRHKDPEKNSAWFKKGNVIRIIILDKGIDDYSRKNIESCFIVNQLRAGHKLYNKI